MATLVLSTVGNALGGPVGGAIGALIGQSIDQQLLGASRGPRMGDLKVQSSSYGTQIPRIYGSMRVAGTVIWATDLTESSETSGAKGQPDTVYSYSVSLAVALSSRTAKGIGRIWADGKLLRGASGDFKVSTQFRFYDGSEDQEIDPLIGSVEGIAGTPAYRGLALAVFENLELAEFGNRIPFMTFEVLGDDGAVTLGHVLSDASNGAIACPDAQEVLGYAAYGQSIRAAVEPLIDCYAIELFDDGAALISPARSRTRVSDAELGSSADNDTAPRMQREQDPSRLLPSALRLSYYDPALDYQSGEARASSAEKRWVEAQRELPAAVSASEAKALVQSMIARRWAERDKLILRLPPRYLRLQPGTLLDLNLSPGTWRVEQCTIDAFVVIAEMRPSWSPSLPIVAEAGRIISNVDVLAPDVTLALFDLPELLGAGSTTPTLMLAASSPAPTWKSCSVEVVAGEQRLQVRSASRKTVLGRALNALPPGDPYLINEAGAIEVELVDPDQWLLSCDDQALVQGANLAVLGSEVFQFGSAEPLGEGRFRLARLVRARAGTEWAMSAHAVGEPFALIDRETLRAVPVPAWTKGTSASASARSVSGKISASAPMMVSGESVRPLSPVALDVERDAAGGLVIRWTRRSRSRAGWTDEVDVPIGETVERYRVTVAGAQGSIELETSEPMLQATAAQLAGISAGHAVVEVRQIGDGGASRPAAYSITI